MSTVLTVLIGAHPGFISEGRTDVCHVHYRTYAHVHPVALRDPLATLQYPLTLHLALLTNSPSSPPYTVELYTYYTFVLPTTLSK